MAYVRAADLEQVAALVLQAPCRPPPSRWRTLVWQMLPPCGKRRRERAGKYARSAKCARSSSQDRSSLFRRGRSTRSAETLLMRDSAPGRSPRIRVRPAWWPWLPFLPMQIQVTG